MQKGMDQERKASSPVDITLVSWVTCIVCMSKLSLHFLASAVAAVVATAAVAGHIVNVQLEFQIASLRLQDGSPQFPSRAERICKRSHIGFKDEEEKEKKDLNSKFSIWKACGFLIFSV